MLLLEIPPDEISQTSDLVRTGSATAFEDRLKASIEQMGLAEPIKVASDPNGGYLVIDGVMRLNAIRAIRSKNPDRFTTIPAYLLDYDRRYEIRYQSDIYQDLLPSQLAGLVEHLHRTENVKKADIARYIGVSPATLRNYTGLWRLLQRGGLFADVVRLMDAGVIPASNPYAWLRLTADGLREVLTIHFSDGVDPSAWIEEALAEAFRGAGRRFPIAFVEETTSSLSSDKYRVGSDVRSVKRDLGLRRSAHSHRSEQTARQRARTNLTAVSAETQSKVLRLAATSMLEFLA
jgi:hypothetical protein